MYRFAQGKYCSNHGFTLIEALITAVIIALILAIAAPNYAAHTRQSNRAAAQQFMMKISNSEEQYFSNSRSYSTDLSPSGLNLTPPASIEDFYTFEVTATTTPPAYTITATAINNQKEDGDLTFSSDGTQTPVDYW